MKHLFLAGLFCALCAGVAGCSGPVVHTASVDYLVTNQATGDGIAGAKVYAIVGDKTCHTDKTGACVLVETIPSGGLAEQVTVSALGYKTWQGNVALTRPTKYLQPVALIRS